MLGRGDSFNPVEDASVRKVASATRQRLERYYAGPGKLDDVIVTLPVRSYVPRYEHRFATFEPETVSEPVGKTSRRRLWQAIAMLASGLIVWWRLRVEQTMPGSFKILTRRGDISSKGSDVSPRGVELGPYLRESDEVSVLLRFAPGQENQQAGILIWQDDDDYVQLGRRFLGRNQVAFTLEENGQVGQDAVSRYDPNGQAGNPIWLILRRIGNTYRGLISFDGSHWEEMGTPLAPAKAFSKPRVGIYAFNGRRDAPQIAADFFNLSTGISFVALGDDPLSNLKALGWHVNVTCPGSLSYHFGASGLEAGFGTATTGCNAEWTLPLEKGDWEYVTKLDFFVLPDLSAGLNIRGTKGHAIRVVRYELNGPSLCFILDGKLLVGAPDANGSPAVYLKLRNRGGVVTGSFSLNGQAFRELPGTALLSDLGPHPEIGVRISSRRSGEANGSSTASFAFLHRVVNRLEDYR